MYVYILAAAQAQITKNRRKVEFEGLAYVITRNKSSQFFFEDIRKDANMMRIETKAAYTAILITFSLFFENGV